MTDGVPIIPDDAIIVLDIDDTLYLERSYVKSGFVAVGRLLDTEFGVLGSADVLWDDFERGVRGDAFDRVLALQKIPPDRSLVARLVACYREHEPSIELLPDAKRLIDRLGSRRLAGITDGPPASQRAKAKALGLIGRLHPLVFTGEHGPAAGKPNPFAFERVERILDVDPACCWYLADNPRKDFISPLERGWTSIRVRRIDSLHERVDTPDGVPEIESLDELLC